MNGVIAVHPDISYVNPRLVGKVDARSNEYLFRKIGLYLEECLGDGNAVYYIESEVGTPHKGIKRVLKHAKTIPFKEGVQEQFLRTKEVLLEDDISEVSLAGVSIWLCLPSLCALLSGENSEKFTPYDEYALMGEAYLGWDEQKFKSVYNAKIPCTILKGATDLYDYAPKSFGAWIRMQFDPFYAHRAN